MIISVTERGTFRRCRQLWHYTSRNRQALTPLRVPTALNIGTMVHKSGEEWLLHPETNAADHALSVINATIDVAKQQYRSVIGTDPHPSELEGLVDQGDMVYTMLKNYQEFYGSPLPEGYTLVQTEQTMLVPIPDTEHECELCKAWDNFAKEDCFDCNGTDVAYHYLEATLDAVIKDVYGDLWVYERKTYGKKPVMEWLQNNDQFRAYTWALSRTGLGSVRGVLYDGMWKRDVAPKRSLDQLFTRVPITYSNAELQSFGIELAREAKAMARAHVDPEEIFRNYRWDGCWDCSPAIRTLCVMEYQGEDSEYYKQATFTRRENAPWLTDEEPVEVE